MGMHLFVCDAMNGSHEQPHSHEWQCACMLSPVDDLLDLMYM